MSTCDSESMSICDSAGWASRERERSLRPPRCSLEPDGSSSACCEAVDEARGEVASRRKVSTSTVPDEDAGGLASELREEESFRVVAEGGGELSRRKESISKASFSAAGGEIGAGSVLIEPGERSRVCAWDTAVVGAGVRVGVGLAEAASEGGELARRKESMSICSSGRSTAVFLLDDLSLFLLDDFWLAAVLAEEGGGVLSRKKESISMRSVSSLVLATRGGGS